MRLIDADALAASLGITNMDCPKCGWYNGRGCKRGSDFVDACEAIEDAPTIEPDQRWIPCSKELPPYGKHVLTWGKGIITIDCRVPGYEEEWLLNVEAWMPLPEPMEAFDGAMNPTEE